MILMRKKNRTETEKKKTKNPAFLLIITYLKGKDTTMEGEHVIKM